jgi:hypothetical protein
MRKVGRWIAVVLFPLVPNRIRVIFAGVAAVVAPATAPSLDCRGARPRVLSMKLRGVALCRAELPVAQAEEHEKQPPRTTLHHAS